MKPVLNAIGLVALFLIACSSELADPTDGGSATDAAMRSAACVAQDQAVQAALDATRSSSPSPESVLAVKTTHCGTSVTVSADSSLAPGLRTYRIASVTKTYVAGVILKLAAMGKLGLDDAIAPWLPTIPSGAQITIRHLLSHRSGLFNYTDDTSFRKASAEQTFTPAELIAIANANHPYFAPGTAFHYSNTNYIALGIIAEAVGAAELSAQVRTRLLQPGGLTETYFDGKEAPIGSLAPGYDQSGFDVTHRLDPSAIWAAGAMVSTASDAAEWVTRLGRGQVHDAAIQAELETGLPTDQPGVSYGLGVFILQSSLTGGAGPGIGHMGDTYGYHTQAFYFRQLDAAVVSIVTSDAASPNDGTIAALRVLTAPQ